MTAYDDEAKKIEYGIEDLHFFEMTQGPDGTWTCGKPEAVTGAISIALKPVESKLKVHADNIEWHSEMNNEGYEGDLELVRVTAKFRENWLGNVVADDGGIYEVANPKKKYFGIMYRIKNDIDSNIVILFNGTIGRPTEESKTNEEGKSIKTNKMAVSFSPIALKSRETITKAIIVPSDPRFAKAMETPYVVPAQLKASLPASEAKSA